MLGLIITDVSYCWDLSLLDLKLKANLFGIMNTNSNVTCQPTRIMSSSHGDMVNSSIQHGFICNLCGPF